LHRNAGGYPLLQLSGVCHLRIRTDKSRHPRTSSPATSATGYALVAPSAAAPVTRFVEVTHTLSSRLPRAQSALTPTLPNMRWSHRKAGLISPCRRASRGLRPPKVTLPAATSSCPQHSCSPLHCHTPCSTRLTVHILACGVCLPTSALLVASGSASPARPSSPFIGLS